MPTAGHNATLPFTRALAGPMDYTICWSTNRLKTTRAHQLALSVVNYSPLQFLYWYDKPSDVREEPALQFFREVPTVWDETRVPDARIGEYAVVARRSGKRWFLGVISAEARRLRVPLSFLSAGKRYRAELYRSGSSDAEVVREVREARTSETFDLDLPPSGGVSVLFDEM